MGWFDEFDSSVVVKVGIGILILETNEEICYWRARNSNVNARFEGFGEPFDPVGILTIKTLHSCVWSILYKSSTLLWENQTWISTLEVFYPPGDAMVG